MTLFVSSKKPYKASKNTADKAGWPSQKSCDQWMPQKRCAIERNKQAARIDKPTDNSLAYLQRAAMHIVPNLAERLAGIGWAVQVLPNHQTGHAGTTDRKYAK